MYVDSLSAIDVGRKLNGRAIDRVIACGYTTRIEKENICLIYDRFPHGESENMQKVLDIWLDRQIMQTGSI